MKQHARGFTLIELMIVVAIVAILGSLAYPAYTDSILKGKRAQGRTALVDLMQQQERYMTQRNCYARFTSDAGTGATTPAAGCDGVTPATAPFKGFSSDTPANSAYRLSADVCMVGTTAVPIRECVRVIAEPKFADPKVGNLEITTTGLKTCTGTSADATTRMSKVCWP